MMLLPLPLPVPVLLLQMSSWQVVVDYKKMGGRYNKRSIKK
jgi:hypothetical protein